MFLIAAIAAVATALSVGLDSRLSGEMLVSSSPANIAQVSKNPWAAEGAASTDFQAPSQVVVVNADGSILGNNEKPRDNLQRTEESSWGALNDDIKRDGAGSNFSDRRLRSDMRIE